MHLGRWVDKEVIFSPGGGSLSDFDFRVLNFRVFQELPWRPHPGEGPEDRMSDGIDDEDEESQGASPRERQVSDSEDGHLETSASAREDELQDSDGSHPEHESHSHSSVSSIPLSNLSTPMEMDALSYRPRRPDWWIVVAETYPGHAFYGPCGLHHHRCFTLADVLQMVLS